MANLQVKSEDRGGEATVALIGELDFSGLPIVDEKLQEVEASGASLLVLDLRELTFLDSGGLKAIVAASNRASEAGRRLVVVKGPKTVHRILEWTGVDRSLEVVDDPAAVLRREDRAEK